MPIIGREHPADIIVGAPQVSARHAEIEHVREDMYMLTDLGSSNGTWVNGARIESTFVRPGDHITLGSHPVDLRVWIPLVPRAQSGSAAAPAPPFAASPAYGVHTDLPDPPNLHWALVLFFGCVTFGIFWLVWSIKQGQWAWRFDRSSKATLFVALAWCVSPVLTYVWLAVAQVRPADEAIAMGVVLFGLVIVGGVGLMIAAGFDIRRSMLAWFDQHQPGGLRLSGPMTFFFNLLYLQYHMSRIAQSRQTGRGQAQ